MFQNVYQKRLSTFLSGKDYDLQVLSYSFSFFMIQIAVTQLVFSFFLCAPGVSYIFGPCYVKNIERTFKNGTD